MHHMCNLSCVTVDAVACIGMSCPLHVSHLHTFIYIHLSHVSVRQMRDFAYSIAEPAVLSSSLHLWCGEWPRCCRGLYLCIPLVLHYYISTYDGSSHPPRMAKRAGPSSVSFRGGGYRGEYRSSRTSISATAVSALSLISLRNPGAWTQMHSLSSQ
jgi:hypothetical protein